jgi:hypothetical protein
MAYGVVYGLRMVCMVYRCSVEQYKAIDCPWRPEHWIQAGASLANLELLLQASESEYDRLIGQRLVGVHPDV